MRIGGTSAIAMFVLSGVQPLAVDMVQFGTGRIHRFAAKGKSGNPKQGNRHAAGRRRGWDGGWRTAAGVGALI